MGFFSRFIDRITTPVEAESTPENVALWERRAPGWVIQCRKCGQEEPFGKYGICKKAAGTKWNFGKCPQCKKWSWLRICKKKG